MPSVEDRLAALEQAVQQLQHTDVRAGLEAQAYGLSLVHAEVAEVKAIEAEMREEMAGGLAAVNSRLDTIMGYLARLSDPRG